MLNNIRRSPLSELIVRTEHKITLPATIHLHSKVIIESEAIVSVTPKSSSWFAIVCEGDMEIAGSIVYRQTLLRSGTVSLTLDTGEEFSYIYPELAHGGRGGDGASAGKYTGGRGADGTVSFGGGGGGGAMYSQTGSGDGSHGMGQYGGYRYRSAKARGGRGGKAIRFSLGGLVLLFARGKLKFGNGYSIDLRGENGIDGTDGTGGSNGYTYDLAPCGGGGGGPGGAGGHLRAVAKEFDFADGGALTALVEGGNHGSGGKSGNHPKSTAQDGLDGEDGVSGTVRQSLIKMIAE